MDGKMIFDRETAERLHTISLRAMKIIYDDIEELGKELNLNEQEKIMAHYYIIDNYMKGVQYAMKDIGIDDVMVRRICNGKKNIDK